ncbi:MAG: hypothetical protein IJA69_00815 [Clostridia bacterium]|nr:hypothetical protein [Clostridia bacterium]
MIGNHLDILSDWKLYVDHPYRVNCFVTKKDKNSSKKALYAILDNGDDVQVSKQMSVFSYPFAPCAVFLSEQGYHWSSVFNILNLGVVDFAINNENFVGFEYKQTTKVGKLFNVDFNSSSEENKSPTKMIEVYAKFKDGAPVPLCQIKEKQFILFKHLITKFENEIKQQNEDNLIK